MSQGLLKLTSTESARPSNHLVLCRPLLLLPSIFPSIGVFSKESALHIRWPCEGATSHCRAGPGTRVAGCSVPADWKAGEPPALIGWGEALRNQERIRVWGLDQTSPEAPSVRQTSSSLLAYFWLLIGKDPNAGKDGGQEEQGTAEDEMVGWHHQLNGQEFEQAPRDGAGQGSLVCCSPDLATEQQLSVRIHHHNRRLIPAPYPQHRCSPTSVPVPPCHHYLEPG